MKEIKVEWTGRYPNLCSGFWKIEIDGELLEDRRHMANNPESGLYYNPFDYSSVLRQNMDTFGMYEYWYFDENYSEMWEGSEDGLEYDEWIKSPKANDLLDIIYKQFGELTEEEKLDLYTKLSEKDWRSGTCGGCI